MRSELRFAALLLCAVTVMNVSAQNVRGKIVDSTRSPIEGVAVVMQAADSTFMDASVTNSLGEFILKQQPDVYRLIVQHILYETVSEEFTTHDAGVIVLQDKKYDLDEVVIKGERPQVKVQGSVLSYDASLLIENRPISNAQEALLQVPGVIGSENSISLLGAGNLHIIINGKMNTMSMEQLMSLLKSYPASQIKKVEVMYNAPSKYGVRGAVINLELKKADAGLLTGELAAKMIQSYYSAGQVRGNLLYSASKIRFDLLADYSKGKDYSGANTESVHTMQDKVYKIYQENHTRSSFDRANFRLGCDYEISGTSSLSAYYYCNGKWTDANLKSVNDYATSGKKSLNDEYTKNYLHNVHLQYDLNATKVTFALGGDYLGYRSPSNAHFVVEDEAQVIEKKFNYQSNQSIDQWNLFSNIGYRFSKKWDVNAGVSFGYNTSRTNMNYPDTGTDSYNYKQQEQINRVFVETNGEIAKGLTFTVGFECESFKSDFYSEKGKEELWNKWTLFPKLSMNYFINQRNIVQLNFLNNKIYPSYWAVSPLTTYTDSYTITVGNPALKPFREYSGQLLYIKNQKYVFILGTTYMPDHFAQIPYQSKDELKTIYRYENYDFSLFSNLTAIIPFKAGNWLNSRASLHLLRIQDKMTSFYDTSFDNEAYVGAIGLNNTITIPATPLSLQLNGRYQAPAIQGIYKLGHTFDCSFSCKYNIKDKAYLLLMVNNIFLDRSPNPFKMAFDEQYSVRRVKELADVSVQFVWKFGSYKSKEHKQIDSSRLQR